MKKFLIALIALIVVAGGVGAWFVTRTPSSPFDGATAPPASDLVQRGEGVARQGDCVACHTVVDGKPFAGGLAMGTPLGTIYTTNITPDRQAGIGDYSLADFDRAVRQGVARDGRRLYPAMPYPSYAKLSDDDVGALYAFFIHGVPAADTPNRPSEIKWPLNIRWPLALWNLVFLDGGVYAPKPGHDAQWNRGAYLVQAAGHCGACHTPRSPTMNEKALDESSPLYLSGAVLDGWYAPSLRQDHNTGLGRWSEDDIVAFLKKGRNEHAVVFGSMTDAYNNSLQYLSDDDLRAVGHYLKSLPGDLQEGEPWRYADHVADRTAAGGQIYAAKCRFCHEPDGKGQNQWIPPLAGAASSLTTQPVSQVNVTLNGSARVIAADVPDAYRMPPFREQLSDQQIADVLTFVRASWGDHGGDPVKPSEVKALRERTNPASSSPIVLQMR